MFRLDVDLVGIDWHTLSEAIRPEFPLISKIEITNPSPGAGIQLVVTARTQLPLRLILHTLYGSVEDIEDFIRHV